MRTPRPTSRAASRPTSESGRGIGTLIGNGWLRESPRNLIPPFPRAWDVRSRSALRKCMMLEMPPELAERASRLPPSAPLPFVARPLPRAEAPSPARPRSPERDVRMFTAVSPAIASAKPKAKETSRAWWEDPLALGALLILAPPMGLACVWSSKRYSNDARWALTLMSVLVTSFGGAVALAVLLTR